MKTFLLNHRWKIIILVFAIIFIIILNSQRQSNSEDTIVYVTKTGAKYHLETCRSLRYSKFPIKLKDAVKNYTPCKICNPPVLRIKPKP